MIKKKVLTRVDQHEYRVSQIMKFHESFIPSVIYIARECAFNLSGQGLRCVELLYTVT